MLESGWEFDYSWNEFIDTEVFVINRLSNSYSNFTKDSVNISEAF